MKKTIQTLFACLTVMLVWAMQPAYSQDPESTRYDSNYIRSYPEKLGVRLFAMQRYASFKMPEVAAGRDIHYHSNRKATVGLGGAYRNIALTLAFGLGYLNNDNIGKTKGLDLRFNLTPYKWNIDLLGSFNKGNYLSPKGYLSANPGKYYFRPDVKLDLIGLGVYRVVNASRFSANAAATQVYWQTKSAGTLLYGGEAYYGLLKGDSALIPANAMSDARLKNISKITFLNIGPGLGYAYTLVMAKYYFISGSIIGNVDLNIANEAGASQAKKSKTGIAASAVYKGAAGFNSPTWSLSANVTGNLLTGNPVYTSKDYLYNTGNFRITLAKKLDMRHSKKM